MRVLKIAIASGSTIWTGDAIKHKGQIWLVPQWLEAPLEGWRTPARIILLRRALLQKTSDEWTPHDFVLRQVLPKELLDTSIQVPEGTGFLVVDRPDIRLPIGSKGVH